MCRGQVTQREEEDACRAGINQLEKEGIGPNKEYVCGGVDGRRLCRCRGRATLQECFPNTGGGKGMRIKGLLALGAALKSMLVVKTGRTENGGRVSLGFGSCRE